MSLMPVDLGQPVLFCHLPKTGGTSIRNDRRVHRRLISPEPDFDRLVWYRPMTSEDLAMPSFTMVRDPLDRVESCWRDFRFTRRLTSMDFMSFLDAHGPGSVSDSQMADPRTAAHHLAPMTHRVHGIRHVKFVGRTEYLQRDMDRFLSRNGLDLITFPRMRVSIGDRLARTRAVVSAVERLYAADYEFLAKLEQAA